MQISVLVENQGIPPCEGEHGLSLWVQLKDRALLFDMGASDLFVRNAVCMGVDLAAAQLAVLSHGHYDHGGGLAAFLAINSSAPVFLSAHAFEPHFSLRPTGEQADIGLDPALDGHPQLHPVCGDCRLDEELTLFSNVEGKALRSRSNDVLLEGTQGERKPDAFVHEQNLLIREGESCVLITGCAHRGIVNIIQRAQELADRPLRAVVGGFHLSNPRTGVCEPDETLDGVAAYLAAMPARYYTGHCTGRAAMARLEAALGPRIHYFSAGETLEI